VGGTRTALRGTIKDACSLSPASRLVSGTGYKSRGPRIDSLMDDIHSGTSQLVFQTTFTILMSTLSRPQIISERMTFVAGSPLLLLPRPTCRLVNDIAVDLPAPRPSFTSLQFLLAKRILQITESDATIITNSAFVISFGLSGHLHGLSKHLVSNSDTSGCMTFVA